jgi:hypothetical protein
MGLMTGEFPPVDPATFRDLPYRERLNTLTRHWAEYGFGAPKITAVIYVVKLLVFSTICGVLLATLTSGLDPLEPGRWWDEPIVYQKLVCWVMLIEGLGLAGSWGPLAGHFKPMTGGVLYWARTGTLRNPPWPARVPLTAGDGRTPVDVALYLAFLAGLAVCIALPGTQDAGAFDAIGANEGLIPTGALIVPIVFGVLLGLRDKIAFLGARSEQYLPALLLFAFFPFVDMIVAAKLLIVTVWCGAAISKITHHFANVIPPMVSNTPWLSSKAIKRMHYRDFPEDLRPSKNAVRLAHGPGTVVELGLPLVLLFSQNDTVTLVAVIGMLAFHVFITSTFPLAVPLEWNALFMYITAFLFLGFPANDGYAVGDMETGLLIGTLAVLLFFPVLGNNRPDLVSFLPSLRQYSGNWASAMWAFAPGKEEELDRHLVKPALMQKAQLTAIYGEDEAEVVLHQLLGWRSLHSQGRGLNSVMWNTLGDDLDTYTLREAEFSCNAVTGFNFGDGHFHDERLIAAIQKRCGFAPGEFIVVWVESEAIGRGRQHYKVIDAAVGVVERGSWKVAEAVAEQPWLPNGPIATQVDWRMPGYERVRHGAPAVPAAEPVPA